MRTPDILVIELKYHSTIGAYTMNDLDSSNSTVLCVYFASAVIPIGLFNSAILINATRWLHLIYMFKKKKDASDRSFHFYSLLGILLFITFFITTIDIV